MLLVLLCACGAKETTSSNQPLSAVSRGLPLPELSMLTGEWLSKDLFDDIQQTKQPMASIRRRAEWSKARAAAKPLALGFIVTNSAGGSNYELSRTNFHEGSGTEKILRLEQGESSGKYRLVVESSDHAYAISLRFQSADGEKITSLVAGNIWNEEPEQPYVRLRDSIDQGVNRVVLAGEYTDTNGSSFHFSELGQARWPDRMFGYHISLDPFEVDCEYFYTDEHNSDARKLNGYRWHNDQLELYKINRVESSDCVFCCDKTPFAILRPKR